MRCKMFSFYFNEEEFPIDRDEPYGIEIAQITSRVPLQINGIPPNALRSYVEYTPGFWMRGPMHMSRNYADYSVQFIIAEGCPFFNHFLLMTALREPSSRRTYDSKIWDKLLKLPLWIIDHFREYHQKL